MPRQKQLSIALQRIDDKKPRLWQLSTDRSESLRSTRSAVSTRYNQTFVALVYSCSNILGTHCNSNSCLYNMRTHNCPLLAYDVQAL